MISYISIRITILTILNKISFLCDSFSKEMEQSLTALGVLHVLLESFPQACIQGVAIIIQMTYQNDEQCLPSQNKLENITVQEFRNTGILLTQFVIRKLEKTW